MLQAQSLQQAGRLAEARHLYLQLLGDDPMDALALHYLGMADFQAGDASLGMGRVSRSIVLSPQQAAFYSNRGTISLTSGDPRGAQLDCARALCLQADLIDACINRARCLMRLRSSHLALSWARRAVQLSPTNVDARLEFANLVVETSESSGTFGQESLRGFHELISVSPGFAEGLAEFGRSLLRFHRADDARQVLAWAFRVQQDHPAALSNAGMADLELGLREQALMSFTKGYLLNPSQTAVASNAALCLLLLGRYAEGWGLYESRLRTDSFWSSSEASRRFFESRPVFSGGLSSHGKRVLVWGEQGVGDEVMFGGLVGEFRGLCGEVLLQVDRRLMGMFERALPGVRVFERGKAVPEELYDEQIPIGSLGKWLRPSRESFEGKGLRYLGARPGLGERLRGELGVLPGEKLIGLSWRSASPETGAVRSLGLGELVGALGGVEGVRFVNLQYGDVREELAWLRRERGVEVLSHGGVDNREDLEGLAGLIEGCDLVVSVGNATAHLSGALGQKTWVLLPYVAGWRWLHEGSTCPWYQSVRLYRQSKRDDWTSVLRAIRESYP
jgi:tetratricopeptide (TPR) repeat protein